MQNIPCVILCGGKSSRMQRDKCFLRFKHKSLVRYQYDKMSGLFKRVFISCKEDKFKGEFSQMIFDEKLFGADFHSPMLALYSILKSFENSFVFIIAVDMPFVSKDSIQALIKRTFKARIILAKTKNKEHFLCGLYHSSLASLCLDLLNKNIHKIRTLSQNAPTEFVEFAHTKEWANLNSPQDYELFKNA